MRGQAALAIGACGVAIASIAGCGKDSKPTSATPLVELRLLATHPLTIQEPSDLAIDETGTILWTVTNHPEKVYRLDLDGNVTQTLSYVGDDLEGVAYDARDHTLWIAEENLRQVVHLDLDGAVLSKHSLALTGEHNSGLEGICLNDSGTVFVLNEKHPGLVVRVAPDFTLSALYGLNFSLDYSGMAFDPQRHGFWIVGDQTQRLYLWTPNRMLEQYQMSMPKPEGVAVDVVAHRVYIVSDYTNALYVLQYPGSSASAP